LVSTVPNVEEKVNQRITSVRAVETDSN